MKPLLLLCGCLSAALAACFVVRFNAASHAATAAAEKPHSPMPVASHTPAHLVPKSATAHPLSQQDLEKFWPNEIGIVPILEYHEIGLREAWMERSIPNFKKDLKRLYDENYRPVSLDDYLSNRIDLPAGKSPVILTFDDSRGTQFRYLGKGRLDPNCAVAILHSFHDSHPDFALKGAFFVLPKCPFDQPDSAGRKLKRLVEWGFEIGNHTVRHRMLNRLSNLQVEREIAGAAAMLHRAVPAARVETLAFPGGCSPCNHRLIAEGQFHGLRYRNRAGFLAADCPAPAPAARNQDRLQIKRIVACEGELGVTYWLNRMRSGAVRRYVSDGDPLTTTVPVRFAGMVDRKRLCDSRLRLY